MPNASEHKKLDKPVFEQLFKTHFVHLCNFAYQFVKDTDSAKEVTQKVFINLWENREKIDPQKSIQSYLFTSVRNRSLNYIRDQKKYRNEVLDLETHDFEIPFEEDAIAMDELKEKVARALDELPEKCRLVFEMSRYKNMKYKEIAEELDISVKTVEAHMSKALKSLRINLEDYACILLIILGWLN
jgi:RNA polymerase sigma-19 factor, ECF subfamily